MFAPTKVRPRSGFFPSRRALVRNRRTLSARRDAPAGPTRRAARAERAAAAPATTLGPHRDVRTRRYAPRRLPRRARPASRSQVSPPLAADRRLDDILLPANAAPRRSDADHPTSSSLSLRLFSDAAPLAPPREPKQKRYAVCSALAASAVPPPQARGHAAESPRFPSSSTTPPRRPPRRPRLSSSSSLVGAYADVEKVKDSRNLRSGKGKLRNRRYVQRRGPPSCTPTTTASSRRCATSPASSSAPWTVSASTLGLGGHLGRFIIWTKGAFEKLDAIYGTSAATSSAKKGWKPPPTSWRCPTSPASSTPTRFSPRSTRPRLARRAPTRPQAQPAQEQGGDGSLQPLRQGCRGGRQGGGGALRGEGEEGGWRPGGWRQVLRPDEAGVQLRGRALRRLRLVAHRKPDEEEA